MEPLIRRHCTLDWNRPERFSAGFIGREIETIPTSITTVEFRSFSMETIEVTRLVAVIYPVFIQGPGLKRWYELCPTKIQVSNNWYSPFSLSFFFSFTLSILLYLLFGYPFLFFFDRTEKQYSMREKVPLSSVGPFFLYSHHRQLPSLAIFILLSLRLSASLSFSIHLSLSFIFFFLNACVIRVRVFGVLWSTNKLRTILFS